MAGAGLAAICSKGKQSRPLLLNEEPFAGAAGHVPGEGPSKGADVWRLSCLPLQLICPSGLSGGCSFLHAFKKCMTCCYAIPIMQFTVANHIHFLINSLSLNVLLIHGQSPINSVRAACQLENGCQPRKSEICSKILVIFLLPLLSDPTQHLVSPRHYSPKGKGIFPAAGTAYGALSCFCISQLNTARLRVDQLKWARAVDPKPH